MPTVWSRKNLSVSLQKSMGLDSFLDGTQPVFVVMPTAFHRPVGMDHQKSDRGGGGVQRGLSDF